jgi:hypothetical protein
LRPVVVETRVRLDLWIEIGIIGTQPLTGASNRRATLMPGGNRPSMRGRSSRMRPTPIRIEA